MHDCSLNLHVENSHSIVMETIDDQESSSDPFELNIRQDENIKKRRRGPYKKKLLVATVAGTATAKKSRSTSKASEKKFLKQVQTSSGKFLYHNIRQFYIKNNRLDDEHQTMLEVALDRGDLPYHSRVKLSAFQAKLMFNTSADGPVILDPCSGPSSDDEELINWIKINDATTRITRQKASSSVAHSQEAATSVGIGKGSSQKSVATLDSSSDSDFVKDVVTHPITSNDAIFTWESLNRDFEVKYGSKSIITAPPSKDDVSILRSFITSNKNADEVFLAEIWLQKFSNYGTKRPTKATNKGMTQESPSESGLLKDAKKASKNINNEVVNWETMNRNFEVKYGSKSIITAPPSKDDVDALLSFITHHENADEVFLARNWYQKFSNFSSKRADRLIKAKTSSNPTSQSTSKLPKQPVNGIVKTKVMSEETIDVMAKNYDRKFAELYAANDTSKNRCPVPTKEVYDVMLQVLLQTYEGKMSAREYNWLRDLTLIKYPGSIGYALARGNIMENFIKENGANNLHNCPRLAHSGQIFQILLRIHDELGHARIEKTYKEVCLQYSNISRAMVELFCELCPLCALDKVVPSRKLPIKAILSSTLNDRGQMDCIDMQSCPDGQYRWILHYQDHLTKFSYCRALRKKTATNVAWELYQIFMMQGFPLILQSDNGKEFVNNVLKRLKRLSPQTIIVRGRPRHPQTNGSNERGNSDINHMVGKWMKNTMSNHWAIGIHDVCRAKNSRWHKTLKAKPYDLLYGQVQRTIIKNLPIDVDLLNALATESQLAKIIGCHEYAGKESDDDYFGSDSEESEDVDIIDNVPGLNPSVFINVGSEPLNNVEEEEPSENDSEEDISMDQELLQAEIEKKAREMCIKKGFNKISSMQTSQVKSRTDCEPMEIIDLSTNQSTPLKGVNNTTSKDSTLRLEDVGVLPPDNLLEPVGEILKVDLRTPTDSSFTKGVNKTTSQDSPLRLQDVEVLPPDNLFEPIGEIRKVDLRTPTDSSFSEVVNKTTSKDSTLRNEDVEVAMIDKPMIVNPSFSIPQEWLTIYRNKYFNPRKKYVPVHNSDSTTKQCGCENVRCTTSSTTTMCGYCTKPMRSVCIEQGGLLGICRQCYMYQHCLGQTNAQPDKPNADNGLVPTTYDSPKRGVARAKAAQNMIKAGEGWNRNRREGNLPIPLGGVVSVSVPNVDRAHPDARRIPMIVVEIMESTTEQGVTFYRLACPVGVLKNSYLRNELVHENHVDPKTYGMNNVLQDWKHLTKRISIREASAYFSSVGGQGMKKCNCKKTTCNSKTCACFKAGRRCGSRCHPANSQCKNHDECAGDALPLDDVEIQEEESSEDDEDPDDLGDQLLDSD